MEKINREVLENLKLNYKRKADGSSDVFYKNLILLGESLNWRMPKIKKLFVENIDADINMNNILNGLDKYYKKIGKLSDNIILKKHIIAISSNWKGSYFHVIPLKASDMIIVCKKFMSQSPTVGELKQIITDLHSKYSDYELIKIFEAIETYIESSFFNLYEIAILSDTQKMGLRNNFKERFSVIKSKMINLDEIVIEKKTINTPKYELAIISLIDSMLANINNLTEENILETIRESNIDVGKFNIRNIILDRLKKKYDVEDENVMKLYNYVNPKKKKENSRNNKYQHNSDFETACKLIVYFYTNNFDKRNFDIIDLHIILETYALKYFDNISFMYHYFLNYFYELFVNTGIDYYNELSIICKKRKHILYESMPYNENSDAYKKFKFKVNGVASNCADGSEFLDQSEIADSIFNYIEYYFDNIVICNGSFRKVLIERDVTSHESFTRKRG